MKLLEKKPKKTLINITSLIDVLFILLIFFMVSSTFIEQPGMDLELPAASTSEREQVKEFVVYVDQKQNISLNEQAVSMDNFEEQLRKKYEETGYQFVVLRADKNVPHGTIVKIMDKVKKVGIPKLVIATEMESN